MVSLSVALAGGLVITHSLVPPTPGPLGVAGTFGIDVGNFLLLGLVVSIPMTLAVMFYGKWLGKKIYQIPGDKEGEWQRPPYQKPQYDTNGGANAKKLPNAFVSFMPIVLAEASAVVDSMRLQGLAGWRSLLGHPVLSIGRFTVPVIASTLRVGDDLTAAALLRGLGSYQRPTSRVPPRLGRPDLLWGAITGVLAAACWVMRGFL